MHTPVSYIDKEGRPKICLHKHQHLPEALFSEKTAGVRATDQLVSAKTLQKQKHPSSDKEGREEKDTEGKASMDRAKKGVNRPGSRDSPKGKTVLVELAWDIPMSMALPIQVKIDATHQPFPFLDTTPADPEIRESEVKEKVVWFDTKKTEVKTKAGKLNKDEITILEVTVKA